MFMKFLYAALTFAMNDLNCKILQMVVTKGGRHFLTRWQTRITYVTSKNQFRASATQVTVKAHVGHSRLAECQRLYIDVL